MNKQSSKLNFLGLFVMGSALFFTGCSDVQHELSPSDTLVGGGYSMGRSNWVDRVESFPDTGLVDRSKAQVHCQDKVASVFFDFDNDSIGAAERGKLSHTVDLFKAAPSARVNVTGHCDYLGTKEYNLGLGDRRASSVKQELVSMGLPSQSIETSSRGSLDATAEGSDDQRTRDRRADIEIVQ